MQARSEDLVALIERVERLENQNRGLKGLMAILLIACICPLLIAAGKATETKVVEAGKVVVRDQKGAIRAELGTQPDGSAALSFLDGTGGATMTLRGAAARPIVEMADGAGGSVWLSSSATGASLSLSKGKGEIEVAVNGTGEPSVKLQDRDGKIVWHAP